MSYCAYDKHIFFELWRFFDNFMKVTQTITC